MNNSKVCFAVLVFLFGTYCVTNAQSSKEELPLKIDRDIELNTFVPKGQWIVGSSVAFSVSESNDYNFFVIESIDGDSHSVKISPVICYSFADNQAAGVRGYYKRNFMKIDSVSFALDDDFDGSAGDYYIQQHSFSCAAVYRYYISLGNSQRFGIYNELQLEYGGGKSKLVNGAGKDMTGTFQTTQDFKISFVPGLVAFINDYTAAEVSVGVLGFGYSKTKQITNQVYEGNFSTSSGNFRVNLFSISLGLAFYL